MLNKRMIARSIVATTAAAALAFTTVGVAQADDHSITKLPAKASLQAGESVSVDVVTDEGFACDSWTTKVVGKKRMRTNVTVSGPESLEGCDVGQPITFQVSLDEEFTKKGRAVVKFIVLSADGSEKKVKSLNVKLNRGKAASKSEGKKDRPAKGKKKSESGTADDSDSSGKSSSDDADGSDSADTSDAS
jgi:methionine-rich copper-binding protein CopC